jgi:hypothetical protein
VTAKEASDMLTRDKYAEVLEAALTAITASGSPSGGDEELQKIRYVAPAVPRRSTPSKRVRLRTFSRDGFYCRYCDRKVIFSPVLQLLGILAPELFPYNANWRGDSTHPAAILCSAVVDHVEPGAWSGKWDVEPNLVTACNPCNAAKSDLPLSALPGWQLKAIRVDESWDGLTRFYPGLYAIVEPRLMSMGLARGWDETGVERERRFHEAWLREIRPA